MISKNKKSVNIRRATTAVMALGFAAIIAVGTILLTLPAASASKTVTPPLDALFTAVSATCVTGLTVVETGVHWSLFGQTVILVLIQIGGLGFMSLAALILSMIRRAITPRDRMLLAMSYNVNDYGSLRRLLRSILVGTFVFEAAGAILLSCAFVPQFGAARGIYYGIFHSVSSFCNAGFDVLGGGNSLCDYAANPLVCLTVVALITVGGIGFPVWNDVIAHVSRKLRGKGGHPVSAYTKLVLILSLFLTLFGAACVACLEWNNPETLGNLTVGEKLLGSVFQSATWRTAGYYTFGNAAAHDTTKLLGCVFMFVGGGSGSTAGGVKIASVAVIALTVISVAVGKRDVNVFRRRITEETVMRALTVIVIQLFLVFCATAVCAATNDAPIIDLLYEVVSAGATVGISAGLTPSLSVAARVSLMFMMYFGRVGILTVTYAAAINLKENKVAVKYPDANIPIG